MAPQIVIQKTRAQLIHDSLPRVQAALTACVQSSEAPPGIEFILNPIGGNEPLLVFRHKQWGSAGVVQLVQLTSSQTLLQFPQLPSPDLIEVLPLGTPLRESVPDTGSGIRLWDVHGRRDKILEILQDKLHRNRLVAQQVAYDWLCQQLRIYGYRCQEDQPNSPWDPGDIWGESAFRSTRIEFSFLIRGTAARFASLVMHWKNCQYFHLSTTSEITEPDSDQPLRFITLDHQSVRVVLRSDWTTLYIFATTLADDQTELRVDLVPEEHNWELWDQVRDELEKHELFTLENINRGIDKVNTRFTVSEQVPGLHTEHLERSNGNQGEPRTTSPPLQVKKSELAPGSRDQLLVKMWRAGYSAREIGERTNRTAKTILNRLSILRKEYGEEVVPRRRSGKVRK